MNALMGFMHKLLKKPLRLALNVAGRVYVPGHEVGDALAVAQRLAEQHMACTLGYFHGWMESGQQIADISCSIIDAVASLEPRGYISIKAPAFHYDPTILAAIVAAAREQGILAHFDAHEHATADPTLACVRQAVALRASAGLTIPGRWRRSPADADLACQLGIRVRVVKGEWADPDEPEMDMRHGYLQVIDRLAGQATDVAVATHDPWLARESLKRLQAAGTRCELELLNGLPKRTLLAIAQEFSVPVRVYIPFGISWRPYALGKVADNPRILWWLVRDSIVGLSRCRNHPGQ
jgi:proline dehydrogenase